MHKMFMRAMRPHAIYASRSLPLKKKKLTIFHYKIFQIMKNLIFTLTVLILMVGQANGQSCNNLIVTEIVFGNIGSSFSGEATQFNHSVEVFNPTDLPIDLANYTIELLPETGDKTVIELEGIVPPEDVFVISNVTANTGIASVSDVLDLLLSFEGKVAMQLTKLNGDVVDKVGRQGVESTSTTIDFSALLNDPNYLESFDINLGSIENLLIRRSRLVQEGKSEFTNEDLLKEWAIYPNFEIDDLGFHTNACLVPILAWDNVSFLDPDASRVENNSAPVFGTVVSSEELAASVDIFVANVGHEFVPIAPSAFVTEDYTTSVDPFDNITLNAGDEGVELELLTAVNDFFIEPPIEGTGFYFQIDEDNNPAGAMEDFNKDVFDVEIIDDETTSTQTAYLNSKIEVFPTIVEQFLNLSTSDNIRIESVLIFDVSAKSSLIFEGLNTNTVQLDLNSIKTSGYQVLYIQTELGTVIKKIYKH